MRIIKNKDHRFLGLVNNSWLSKPSHELFNEIEIIEIEIFDVGKT